MAAKFSTMARVAAGIRAILFEDKMLSASEIGKGVF